MADTVLQMKIAYTITISDINGLRRNLQICVGDVTTASESGQVDVLAISCFPDDYLPRPHTIVGQLKAKGVDLHKLSLDKAIDDRLRWQTWISQPLGISSPFGRIACFEHGLAQKPNAVVGNLFRALTGFAIAGGSNELGTVRVPLLATGDQQANMDEMLEAIIRQAYNQLRLSLPVETVQIVLYSGWNNLFEMILKAGLTIKQVQQEWAALQLSPIPSFDYFVSYRRVDHDILEIFLKGLNFLRPNLRIFLDKKAIPHGVFWKPELVGSIYNSKKFLCLITDSYTDSGECVDEFHAALSCGLHRDNFLVPLQLLSRYDLDTLPSAFRSVNLIDARCPPNQFSAVLDAILD